MLSLLLHELKYYFKNTREAIYIYGLFVSIVVLAPFGLPSGLGGLAVLAPLILWIALATTVSLGGMGLFQRDKESGALECYQLLPVPLEALLLGKWLAFYGFILVPLLMLLPVAGLLLGVPPEGWLQLAIGLGVGAAALSLIASLASALMVGLEKAGAVLSLVVLPLSIPVMIFGAAYCQKLGQLWQPSLLFNLGFAALMLPIYCLAGASCVRASN